VLVAAILIMIVVTHTDETRSTFQRLLQFFRKPPLVVKIPIGCSLWLVSVVVPGILAWYVFGHKFEESCDDEGEFVFYLVFIVFWPLAWPIALIVVPILLLRRH
jgi:hypothetical protein